MGRLRVVEEGFVGAPAERVYGYIADLREHHPRFLPPSFGELRIEEGGYGAGTVYRVTVSFAGSTRELHMRVDEPEPGRVITETVLDAPMTTTWTVTPEGAGCRVRLETVWTGAGGFQGVLESLFAPLAMRRVYRDELARLDRYAREQAGAAQPAA